MFMITLNKKNIKRIGLGAVAIAVICGGWFLSKNVFNNDANADDKKIKISSTEDIQTFFTGYGFTVDPVNITADKVEIPKSWDDSFSAFNSLVAQSGMALDEHKGDTVEKWLAFLPAQSSGDKSVYGVLLVEKEKAVGAYILEKPSGKVIGFADAVAKVATETANAEQTSQEIETNLGLPSGESTNDTNGDIFIEILPEEASADILPETVFPTE